MMQSVATGVYKAEGQPDIVVLYGGEIKDDPKHTGPWIQWRFPWETDVDYTTTLVFQFESILGAVGYELKEPRESIGMQFK
jgi:hypothetical protein